MPRIPTQNAPQVREQVTQAKGFKSRLGDTTSKVNLTGELFGAAARVAEMQEKETLNAEDTQLQEMAIRFREKKIELTHDKDKGFFKEQGINASKNEKLYYDEFDKFAEEQLGTFGANSERLKNKANVLKMKNRVDLKQQFSSHTGRQTEIYENDVFNSNIKSLTNEAILDNNKIGDNLQSIKNSIYGNDDLDKGAIEEGVATKKGMKKEVADGMYLKAATDIHSAVLTNMMNIGEDKMANDYFKSAIGAKEIDGETAIKLEKALQNSSIRGEGQRSADYILNQNLSPTESMKMARSIDDEEVRDEAVSRVKNRISEEKQFDRMETEDNYQEIFLQVEKTNSLDGLGSRLDKLSHAQRTGIKNYLSKKLSGKGNTTNMKAYYQLEQMAGRDRNKFKDINLWEFRGALDDSDFKKMSGIQRSLRSGKGMNETSKLLDGIQSKNGIVNGGLKSMGIDYGGSVTKAQADRGNLFRKKVDELITDKQVELGRKINNNEVQTIVDDLRVDVVIDRDYLSPNDTKRKFELTQEDIYNMDYDDILSEDIKKIKESFKNKKSGANNNPTEKEIFKVYIDKINKDRGSRNGN